MSYYDNEELRTEVLSRTSPFQEVLPKDYALPPQNGAKSHEGENPYYLPEAEETTPAIQIPTWAKIFWFVVFAISLGSFYAVVSGRLSYLMAVFLILMVMAVCLVLSVLISVLEDQP